MRVVRSACGRDGGFAPRARDGELPATGRGRTHGLCPRWECTPHSLLSCQKRMRRARWKRKALFVSTVGPLGQVWTDGSWWLDVPPGPEIFCRVRYTGYEFRTAPPHLGAWVQIRGGRRKAFTTGPVCSASLHTTRAVTLALTMCAGLGSGLELRRRRLGAWVRIRGGHRKAFTTGPVCSVSLHTTRAVTLAADEGTGLGMSLKRCHRI